MEAMYCRIVSGPDINEIYMNYQYRVVTKFSIEVDGQEVSEKLMVLDGLIPKEDEGCDFFINGLTYIGEKLYRFYGAYNCDKRDGYMDIVSY
jgi:hypothetical protein